MSFLKTKDDIKKIYQVSDFYLACFLKAKEFKLLTTEQAGKRVVFIFEDKSNREQLTKDFYNDAEVKVSAFIHAIQDLKSIIYNVTKKEKETPLS